MCQAAVPHLCHSVLICLKWSHEEGACVRFCVRVPVCIYTFTLPSLKCAFAFGWTTSCVCTSVRYVGLFMYFHRASLRRELHASPCCWPDSTVTQPVSVVCARVCYSFGFIMWTSWVTIPLQVKVHHHYWFYQSHTAELWSIFPGRTCKYYTGWTHPLHTVRSSLI